jgi:hypothetical protein
LALKFLDLGSIGRWQGGSNLFWAAMPGTAQLRLGDTKRNKQTAPA